MIIKKYFKPLFVNAPQKLYVNLVTHVKLKLQYFGHLMRRADSFEKTLMLGKIEGRRRRGRQDEVVGWHNRLNGHRFA